MKSAQNGGRWIRDKVAVLEEHVELRYQDNEDDWSKWPVVARVGAPEGNVFKVEFLIEGTTSQNAEMIRAVEKELTFYLVEKGEEAPWTYARYHCGTAANIYSQIHWSFVPSRAADQSEQKPVQRTMAIVKIVSDGQTGADRAALDWAIKNQVEHDGWCPKGRKAEDAPIAACYLLKESSSSNYLQRTEWNVRDSDGTVIFTIKPDLTGGSKRTAEFAEALRKPWVHISAAKKENAAAKLKQFIEQHQIKALNVAGSRASKEPAVGEFVLKTLDSALLNDATVEKKPAG